MPPVWPRVRLRTFTGSVVMPAAVANAMEDATIALSDAEQHALQSFETGWSSNGSSFIKSSTGTPGLVKVTLGANGVGECEIHGIRREDRITRVRVIMGQTTVPVVTRLQGITLDADQISPIATLIASKNGITGSNLSTTMMYVDFTAAAIDAGVAAAYGGIPVGLGGGGSNLRIQITAGALPIDCYGILTSYRPRLLL